MVFERGGDGAVGSFQQWGCVADRFAAHDGGAGVHTGLADQAFDAHRLVRDAFRVRIGAVQLAEFAGLGVSFRRRVEDVVQRDVLAAGLRGWQRLGDAFADRELVSHDSGGVLQRLLGFDGAVDHALRHFVAPVLFTDVVEHAATAVRVEVHIDIRQRDAFRVEESFEDQTMLDRVQFGDAHRVRHHGACRGATARPHHHAVRFRPIDVVGHDEEVAAELHLADHAAFVIGLLEHLDGRIAVVALFEALLHLLEEQRGLVPAFGAVELRHERAVLVVVEHDVASFRDLQRVVAGARQVFEEFAHLLGGFDVIAGAVEFEPSRFVQRGTGVDAQHGVLRAGILGAHIVGIVGGEQRGVQLLRDLQQVVGHLLFDVQPVIHEFDIEIVASEDVLQFAGRAQRLVELPQTQPGLDDARGASAADDDAFRIFGEDLLVHSGVTHDAALKIRVGGGLHQIDEALVVFRPHRQVGDQATARHVVGVAPAMHRIDIRIPIRIPADSRRILTGGFRRHVGLDADDRLDAGLDRVAPQFVCAMHVSVVGKAHRGHAQFLDALHQIRDFRGAVQQRIMRMVVQMYEVSGSSHAFQSTCAC